MKSVQRLGNNRSHVLPLVPEPTTVEKKEDVAQVNLLSNPTDANSVAHLSFLSTVKL